MPVPLSLEKDNVKYNVPRRIKTYICNQCHKDVFSLRWIEKFSQEKFKCDDCWHNFRV
jgi:predicted SprT family Zn-dependent metalloprotease